MVSLLLSLEKLSRVRYFMRSISLLLLRAFFSSRWLGEAGVHEGVADEDVLVEVDPLEEVEGLHLDVVVREVVHHLLQPGEALVEHSLVVAVEDVQVLL
jgi:hypothetical protein